MHHLTSAAQDTTSGTLSWMLYELAKRPDYQARIRAEIRAGRARVAERGTGAGFTLEEEFTSGTYHDARNHVIDSIFDDLRLPLRASAEAFIVPGALFLSGRVGYTHAVQIRLASCRKTKFTFARLQYPSKTPRICTTVT